LFPGKEEIKGKEGTVAQKIKGKKSLKMKGCSIQKELNGEQSTQLT